MERLNARPSWFTAPILAAALGEDAGMIGAAKEAAPLGQ
jgi:hypothetical protein